MTCAVCGEAMTHTGPLLSATVDTTPPEQRAQAYRCVNGHTLVTPGALTRGPATIFVAPAGTPAPQAPLAVYGDETWRLIYPTAPDAPPEGL